MRYIKSNTSTGEVEEINVPVTSNTVFDISNDSDDTHYVFDTFEDYKNFANHVKVE